MVSGLEGNTWTGDTTSTSLSLSGICPLFISGQWTYSPRQTAVLDPLKGSLLLVELYTLSLLPNQPRHLHCRTYLLNRAFSEIPPNSGETILERNRTFERWRQTSLAKTRIVGDGLPTSPFAAIFHLFISTFLINWNLYFFLLFVLMKILKNVCFNDL